jgi:valyl-tRNA synthetase
MALEKRYDFKKVETGRYEKWKKSGYFTAGDVSKEKFSMVIPPPNVTGKLHIGHTYDNTIQDVTCRYKKAKGYDVLFLPGCDHAGIATQAKVDAKLQEHGISRFDIGREVFLKEAFARKDQYSETIHEQWAKMGLMLDYSRERFTLDSGFQKAVFQVFKKLYDEGLIYRGEKIVNYDPKMKTALSNMEVIYKCDLGSFYYFKYRLVNKEGYIVVATTRPETMFGDVCVCVNPSDERYADLIGEKVINPANGEALPIIGEDYVDTSFGTGAMKCTPAHDPNDFSIGEKRGFPHPIIMNIDGTMSENCGEYAGLDRYVCREKLVEKIKFEGNLVKIEKFYHDVGHSERSDAVVEPILSKQRFVKMKPLAQAVLDNQKTDDRVVFHPRRFEKVLIRWMSNCEDRCISRQLWRGHRIPVYYSKSTGKILVSDHLPDNSGNWEQDEDVLDTWFSSALWPFVTLGRPEETADLKRYFPLNCLSTGYDIIFFWVARMYFQGLKFTGKAPFKDIVIHGIVRDKEGRKMSKSLGNGIDPIEIIDKYGTDSLRYFLATAAAPGQDLRYDETKVVSASNYLNKIWNSARYILLNIPEGYEIKKFSFKELSPLDRAIISKLEKVVKKVTSKMDHYQYGVACQLLYDYVYDDFCSNFLERSKVSLADDKLKDETIYTLLYVLKAIIMMVYPFAPFISEEIYLNLPKHKDSIMLESYPLFDRRMVDEEAEKEIVKLDLAIEDIRSYKVANSLTPNVEVSLRLEGDFPDFLWPYLARFAFAKNIERISAKKIEATSFIHSEFTLYILDEIDKKSLKEKLESERDDLAKELIRSRGILSNSGFLAKAPKEKIESEKKKFADYTARYQTIVEKLEKL